MLRLDHAMRRGALAAVVWQQCLVLWRDRRLTLLGVAVFLAGVTTLAVGAARHARFVADRAAAVHLEAEAWAGQGLVDPHGAAHFGRYAFRPMSPLAAFDSGTSDHLSSVVFLEAHRQSPGTGRPTDGGTALTSFAPFTPAAMLQAFAPLLVILLAFGAFAGERARTLLVQELAAGTSARTLLLGRFLAMSGAVVLLVFLFGGAAAVALARSGARGEEYARLGSILLGYTLYLLAFLALALGVSARCRAARAALTVLLGVWVGAVLLLPRLAPAIGQTLHPVPPGSLLNLEAAEAFDAMLDAGGSQEARPERLRQMVLDTYGVNSVAELPVSLGGALLEYTEELSTRVYRAYFAELYGTYARHSHVDRWLALLSPTLALRPFSAGMAGTDFEAHQVFLSAAEEYRYQFVQALNRDITRNRGNTGEIYTADAARITAELGSFAPPMIGVAEVWARRWPELALLLAWLVGSGAFAIRVTRSLVL